MLTIGIGWHEDCRLSGLRWAMRFQAKGFSLRLLNEGEPWHECDAILLVDQSLPIDKKAKTNGEQSCISMKMQRWLDEMNQAGYDKPREKARQKAIYFASKVCAVEGCASPFHLETCHACKGT